MPVLHLGLTFLPKINAADQFTHNDKIRTAYKLRFERGILDQCISDLDRTKISIQSKTLAQAKDCLLRTQCRLYLIPLITADCTEKNTIR